MGAHAFIVMMSGPHIVFIKRYSCLDSIADHVHADRPRVAADLGLQQPPGAGLGDGVSGEGSKQEGGVLHQEQVQEHAGQAEGH